MRTVNVNEIHGENFSDMLTVEDVKNHTKERYHCWLKYIHHVDTQLLEDEPGKKVWRIQGYIYFKDLKDFKYDSLDAKIYGEVTADDEKLEIWSWFIPYKE